MENGNEMPDFLKGNAGSEKKETPKETVKPVVPPKKTEVVPEKDNKEIEALKKQLAEQSKQFEELKALISSSSNIGSTNQADTITAVLKALKKQDREELMLAENAKIDPDDYLDKPVVYYCYSTLFAIGSDRRKGKELMPPNGTVVFKLFSTKVIQDGKGQGIINYATYQSYSKKEVEYLDNHSVFGIKFFKWDNIDDKTNPEKAKKFIRFAEAMKNYTPVQLKDLCVSNGIKFNPDQLDQAKFELIMKMTDRELERELSLNDTAFNQGLLLRNQQVKESFEIAKHADARGY